MQNDELKEGAISLKALFMVLLKTGTISFGGNIALISMVQKELVEKYKVVSNDFFLNAIAVASLLPGPMAVNVVAYTGYHLRQRTGAIVSLFAVLLPSLILMMALSWLYFHSGVKLQLENLMHYIVGTVCGIILSVGVAMLRKEIIGNNYKFLFTIAAAVVLFFFNSYLVTIVSFIISGVLGFLLRPKKTGDSNNKFQAGFLKRNWPVLVVLISTQLLFATKTLFLVKNIYLKLLLVFGGISLSLFGGGYVMVPIMQSLFVHDLQWVTAREFVDAIAFSQATPGPILVSATFIGFKLGGVTGAILATLGIFVPSAILMILVASLFHKNRGNRSLQAVMDGIKCVVIAMIIIAAFKILKAEPLSGLSVSLFVISFLLSYFKKTNPAVLILATVIVGLIGQYFF